VTNPRDQAFIESGDNAGVPRRSSEFPAAWVGPRMTRQLIRAKAPLRISFAGGGTDVPPFPAEEGGQVLNATINRYAYAALRPRSDKRISIESLDFGLSMNFGLESPMLFDGKLDLVKAAIRRLGNGAKSGYDLFLHSNAPPGSGLGSSSAVMVALIGILKEHLQLPLSEYEVADLAHSVERGDLGLKGGMQDQYAATFGGFNFIEFYGDRVIVNPLRVSQDTINELQANMLLCYTGRTRPSDRIIDDQTARFQKGQEDALAGLRMQKEVAVQMKNALLTGRLREFGELLGTAWEYKKRLSPKISKPFIDEAYEEALKQGALGGKVTGAGGGGYMVFYCDFQRRHKVAEALIKHGVTVTDFSFDGNGLTTWRAHHE
jgi:D-glycero-alpha-D-manno-heptose-7-phosphate kinase